MREKGLNRARLADRLGIERTNVSRWLKGDKGMSFATIQRIAKALDTTADALLFEGPPPAENQIKEPVVRKFMEALALGKTKDLEESLDLFLAAHARIDGTAELLQAAETPPPEPGSKKTTKPK